LADKIIRDGTYLGRWASPSDELKGFDLEGKVLGLVGLGRIGKAVANRAKGFGMKVVAYDPYIDKKVAEELGIELIDLDTLLKESDFVSIHAPLLPETRGIISEKQLKLMKRTAYLINVARGPLVDEKALYKALKEHWIAGAGLDVYEKEPPEVNNPIFTLDNVVLTHHIAWYTEESRQRLEMSAVDEAVRILTGKMPK
jgi:D-3-phosphoglycerate dehydrogenase